MLTADIASGFLRDGTNTIVGYNNAAAVAVVTATSANCGFYGEMVSDGTQWLLMPRQWYAAGASDSTYLTVA
jgi:hypothetical protein